MHKTLWQQMKQKPTQELICGEGQELFPIAVLAVSPAKGDLAVCEGNETVVGDGRSTGSLLRLTGHSSIRHSVEKGDLCKFPGFLHQSASNRNIISA
jgi:hypothetical protein